MHTWGGPVEPILLPEQQRLGAGAVLMKSVAEYYAGTKPARP